MTTAEKDALSVLTNCDGDGCSEMVGDANDLMGGDGFMLQRPDDPSLN